MKFVLTEDLEHGMRLAKPIYNKNGVLLYDRDSKLTTPAINSIRNFGLIGIYILEPAEPLPPMTQEDIEFEQLQTMYIFRLRDLMDAVLARKKIKELPAFLDDILKHYGNLDHRVNFNQNLRSADDFIYKHAISMAILVAMMTSRLGFSYGKQKTMVASSLLYGLGYRYVPKSIIQKAEDKRTADDNEIINQSLAKGLDFLSNYRGDFDFFPRSLALAQVFVYDGTPMLGELKPDDDLKMMLSLLRIADAFDRSTAMNIGHDPESEIMAMEHLKKDVATYPADFTTCLAQCIHICPVAASLDFTDGSKGIVLVENPQDYLKPVVLRIGDNQIYDLSKEEDAAKLTIRDIMKTMDNRILIDRETLKLFIPDERLKELTREFLSGRA